MPFNRLAKKLQHGFEAKHLWINDSPRALSAADTIPKQIHPKVNQDKHQSHKQQSSHGIFSGGADAAMVLNSIAGFDAEAVFVIDLFKNKKNWQVNLSPPSEDWILDILNP
jgi:hypothetical protein